MYQALYRKYRPSTFENVVGQDVIIKTLKNAIKNNQLSHAYIFSGPRGTGKTSVAKILGKAVNCLSDDELICNKCRSCLQIIDKQSTDIIEIDAASNNGIDEIREIRNKVNYVPTNGKYKIYIIDEVHMLTTGAFNALLKTLEEPPAHVIFILATTEPHKIPSTILSRCQKFDFKKINNTSMINRIKKIANEENINVTDDAIKEIVRLADGGMRDCISLLDQVNSYSDDQITLEDIHEINGSIDKMSVLEIIRDLFNKDISNLLKKINKFYDDGKNIVKIAEEVLLNLKNILLLNIDISLVENNEIYTPFKVIEKKEIMKVIDVLNKGINDIKISNDPKLALELIFIKFCSELNQDIKIIFEDKIIDNIDFEKEENKINEKERVVQESNALKSEEEYNIVKNKEKFNESNSNNHDDEEEITKSIALDENNCNIKDCDSFENIMDKLKEIRVNNALSNFSKQTLINYRNNVNKFKNYSFDNEFSYAADIILDGELKIASNEYLVFVYDTALSVLSFNKNIKAIEKLINKVFEKEFKVTAIVLEEWEIIKEKFNESLKNGVNLYDYIEEDNGVFNSLIKKIEEENNDLDSIYGSLIEYE